MEPSLQHVEDQWLVLRCQAGDAAAFEALVRRWQARLWTHARRLTGSAEAATDATQDAWLAIARGLRRLDDPARFPAWAYRITGNKAADGMRTRQRQRTAESNAVRPRPSDSSNDDALQLRHALRELDRDQRVILKMRYLDEMSVNEIAVALDIPEGTVKSRLFHARRRLREAFERSEP